jgi:hypothetical protein
VDRLDDSAVIYHPTKRVYLVFSTGLAAGALHNTAERSATNNIPEFLKATFPSWCEINKDTFGTNNQSIPVAGAIYDAQSVNRLKPSSSK